MKESKKQKLLLSRSNQRSVEADYRGEEVVRRKGFVADARDGTISGRIQVVHCEHSVGEPELFHEFYEAQHPKLMRSSSGLLCPPSRGVYAAKTI
jgi:hypothetical protein